MDVDERRHQRSSEQMFSWTAKYITNFSIVDFTVHPPN